MNNWKTELEKIRQCYQRQDALYYQLEDLIKIADKFGFYDAADYIKTVLEKPNKSIILSTKRSKYGLHKRILGQ